MIFDKAKIISKKSDFFIGEGQKKVDTVRNHSANNDTSLSPSGRFQRSYSPSRNSENLSPVLSMCSCSTYVSESESYFDEYTNENEKVNSFGVSLNYQVPSEIDLRNATTELEGKNIYYTAPVNVKAYTSLFPSFSEQNAEERIKGFDLNEKIYLKDFILLVKRTPKKRNRNRFQNRCRLFSSKFLVLLLFCQQVILFCLLVKS
jgi:hypothetical protein